jgi:TRAP-type C4-dicarboxylate transport system permease small subunit
LGISGFRERVLVETINRVINKVLISIGGLIGFLMMFLVVSNVVGRYLLLPIEGTLEIVELSIVFIVFLSVAYTQIASGHVKVTLLTSSLSHGLRTRLDYFIIVICLFVSICFCLGAFRAALDSWVFKETTIGVDIPVYPAKMVIFLGFLLFSVQMLLELFQRIKPKGKTPDYVE